MNEQYPDHAPFPDYFGSGQFPKKTITVDVVFVGIYIWEEYICSQCKESNWVYYRQPRLVEVFLGWTGFL